MMSPSELEKKQYAVALEHVRGGMERLLIYNWDGSSTTINVPALYNEGLASLASMKRALDEVIEEMRNNGWTVVWLVSGQRNSTEKLVITSAETKPDRELVVR